MQKIIPHLFVSFVLLTGCYQDRYQYKFPEVLTENLRFLPHYYQDNPALPSPAITENNREVVLLKLENNHYGWIDATVENGEPFDYKRRLYGKGNQLMADAEDFPHFARAGIHSKKELRDTKIITGRSVSQITVDGRPWGSSGVGFMADDETIMSVIDADNQTVKKLGLTHPDLARPLFHVWNISREFENYSLNTVTGTRHKLSVLMYNRNEVQIKITGSRGWQESIFDDEILGTGHIEIWRELSTEEMNFLKSNYDGLSKEQLEELQKMVSHIHTSEMVFFYINRYGFYEGHTEYRPDPVTVALVFGLTTMEKAHRACGSDFYNYFNSHFTQNP